MNVIVITNISIRWGKSNTCFMMIKQNRCCTCTADLTAKSSDHENCEGLVYPSQLYKSVVSECSLSRRILGNKVLTLWYLGKTPVNPAHISVNIPEHMSEIHPKNNIYTSYSVCRRKSRQSEVQITWHWQCHPSGHHKFMTIIKMVCSTKTKQYSELQTAYFSSADFKIFENGLCITCRI